MSNKPSYQFSSLHECNVELGLTGKYNAGDTITITSGTAWEPSESIEFGQRIQVPVIPWKRGPIGLLQRQLCAWFPRFTPIPQGFVYQCVSSGTTAIFGSTNDMQSDNTEKWIELRRDQ